MTIGLIANNDGSGAVQLGGTNAISIDTSLNSTMAGYVSAPNTFGFKNRIINGAMVFDQRNNGGTVTPVNAAYTLDRWQILCAQPSKFSIARGTASPPSGFTYYLYASSLSAYNVQTTDYFSFVQSIEGYNIADLNWGATAAAAGYIAAPITISFKATSSIAGTFGGSICNSGGVRSYPFTYTIPVAATWTNITITIPGDVAGTWLTDNGIGLSIRFGLGAGATFSGTAGAWATANYVSATGATSLVATSGAYLAVTGVQIEKGSTATSFDVRDIGRELMLCQRYYNTSENTNWCVSVLSSYNSFSFPVSMRATPSVVASASAGVNTVTAPGTRGFYVSSTATNAFGYTANAEL